MGHVLGRCCLPKICHKALFPMLAFKIAHLLPWYPHLKCTLGEESPLYISVCVSKVNSGIALPNQRKKPWLCSPCPTVSLVPSPHFGEGLIVAPLSVVSQVAHTIRYRSESTHCTGPPRAFYSSWPHMKCRHLRTESRRQKSANLTLREAAIPAYL